MRKHPRTKGEFMVKVVEQLADRMLAKVVPNIVAQADPCECSGVWSREIQCYCYCGAGWAGWSIRQTQSCSGCRLSYGPCHDTWAMCIC
jgi:hypothetical protein